MTEYTPTADEVVMGKTHLGDNFWRDLTEEEIRRWLEEHDRQVAEKAWHEGRSGGLYDGRARNNVTFLDRLNPYRKAES